MGADDMLAGPERQPFLLGDDPNLAIDDLSARLAQAEERYQAAEHDLELLQRLVWAVTEELDGHGHWVLEDGGVYVEVSEEQADAINRALDACS